MTQKSQSQELLNQFEQDLQLRGYAKLTQEAYLRAASRFMDFHGRSIRQAKSRDVGDFLHHLIADKHLGVSSVCCWATRRFRVRRCTSI